MGMGKPDMVRDQLLSSYMPDVLNASLSQVSCASGPTNYWQQDNVLKAKKGAYGEFSFGNCAMSV